MTRFFRSFRDVYIKRKNIRRYLLYALGELFLIIIGIIIALQLNSWREVANLHQKEALYVDQLRTDLISAKDQLQGDFAKMLSADNDTIFTNYYFHADGISDILRIFWLSDDEMRVKLNKDGLRISHSLRRISETPFIYSGVRRRSQQDPSRASSAFSLISSGDINSLQSEKLRSEILKFIQNLDGIVTEIEFLNKEEHRLFFNLNNIFSPQELIFQLERKKGYPEAGTPYPKHLDHRQYPRLYEQVPFPKDLEVIFKNERVFRLYQNLLWTNVSRHGLIKELMHNIDSLIDYIEEYQDNVN
ncbi:MAG: hypothetical protein KJP09_08390 [Bacteroidia bacterium]|nr:hypothetical protein [Bacteroidia bacterium]NND12006.1 hypothetical protein [Flavobacteriaceae bacterium]